MRILWWVVACAIVLAAAPAGAAAMVDQVSFSAPATSGTPPTAYVAPGTQVSFQAQAYGGPYTYMPHCATPSDHYDLDFGDGTAHATGDVAPTPPTTQLPALTHAYAGVGTTYTITLTVTDCTDGSSATTQIFVHNGSRIPVTLSASQAHPVVGEAVTYTASATAAAGASLTYAFSTNPLEQGPLTVGPTTATTASYPVTFTTQGIDDVRVSVADTGTGAGAADVQAAVANPVAGTVTTAPDQPAPGQSVTFTASPTGGYGADSYAWAVDGNPVAGASAQTLTQTLAEGDHAVTATVTDSAQPSHSGVLATTVAVYPPLKASFAHTPADSAGENRPITFDASSTTGGRPPLHYAWDWNFSGFQDAGTAPSTTHAYASAGRYRVLLRVTDSLGRTATATDFVDVVGDCQHEVHFGLVQATTSGCLRKHGAPQGGTDYVSADEISLNGLPFPKPVAGHPIVLTPPTPAHPGGQISAGDIKFPLGDLTLDGGAVAWNLPADSGGHEAEVASFTPNAFRIKKLLVKGSVAVRLGEDPNAADDSPRKYYAAFPVQLELPNVFKSGPDREAGGVTGTGSLRVDRTGPHFDGLKLQVANAWIGKLQVESVCLSFLPGGSSSAIAACPAAELNGSPFLECSSDSGADRWDGNAVIVLPNKEKTKLGVWGGISGGSLSHLGAYVDHLGHLVPLGEGVYLQRVGIGLCLQPPPFKLRGVVGVSALPVGAEDTLDVNGSFLYTDADASNPWSIQLQGDVSLYGRAVGGGSLTIRPTGLIDFDLHAAIALPNDTTRVVSLDGSVSGWIQTNPAAFDIEGSLRGCVWTACATASGVISSQGIAGCLDLGTARWWTLERDDDWDWIHWWRLHWVEHDAPIVGGFGYAWHDRSASLFGGRCDFEPYRATHEAQDAAAGDVAVPPGTAAVALRIAGAGGAPRVLVTGPDGRRLASPAVGSVAGRIGSDLVAENPPDSSTSVLLLHPRGGVWRVTARPGSVPVVSVRVARATAPPVALGAVRGATGGRMTLRASLWLPSGETVTLFERGPRGLAQEIGRPRVGRCPRPRPVAGAPGVPACVTATFTPVLSSVRQRAIVAVVSRDGQPERTITLARYLASPPALPARPRITARRARGGIALSWGTVRGAVAYAVATRLSDGRELAVVPRGRSAFVPAAGRNVAATISVWAVRADGATGRPGHTAVPAQGSRRPPARVPGRCRAARRGVRGLVHCRR